MKNEIFSQMNNKNQPGMTENEVIEQSRETEPLLRKHKRSEPIDFPPPPK